MSTQNPNIGEPPEPGSEGTPTPQPSTAKGEKQASMEAKDLSALSSAELEALIEKKVGERLQSDKDRRISKLEQRQHTVEEQLARYEEYRGRGLSPEQAKREIQIDDLLNAQTNVPPVAGVQQGGDGVPKLSETSKVVLGLLENAGIPANDPAVATILRTASPEAMTKEAAKLIIDRATVPSPTPGATPAPIGGSAPAPETAEALRREYEKRLNDIRPGDIEAINNLKREMRHKGLPDVH